MTVGCLREGGLRDACVGEGEGCGEVKRCCWSPRRERRCCVLSSRRVSTEGRRWNVGARLTGLLSGGCGTVLENEVGWLLRAVGDS